MSLNHVLCPMDGTPGSARALPIAAACSGLLSLPLRVLSAVEDPHEVGRRHAEIDFQVTSTVDHDDVEIVVVPAPHPPKAIAAFAGHDGLVVMATTTHPHLFNGYFGSATESIIRSVHRPVVAVGPACRTTLGEVRGVVVPCDGSSLSEQAVPVGRRWADLLGLDLTVVSVLEPSSAGNTSAETNYVRHLARPVDAGWDVLHGRDVASTLADFAQDQLIVMTSNGRSGLQRLRSGSVTTSTTRQATAPVVIMNPLPAETDSAVDLADQPEQISLS